MESFVSNNGSFTLADPDLDPYSDSDSCTIQILRERDLDPNLNQCENVLNNTM